MTEKIKIATISYINSTPFVYGLRHANNGLCVELLLSTPAECVDLLTAGECDIAIVSVAALATLKDIYIISNYCISATGEVRTVELLSNSNIKDIKNIYLDCDSRTSVELIRILTDEYWHIQPKFKNINYSNSDITPCDGDGYVMIGDKVFGWEHRFTYNYDLSKYWHLHTDLPFVFAVWVARNGVSKEVISLLNGAFAYGISNIDKVVEELVRDNKSDYDTAYSYLTQNIEFDLNDSKRKALELFQSKSYLLKSKEFSSHYR